MVSDLHNAEFGKDNSTLLRMLSKSRPDIIVITGDLADSTHTDIHTALAFAKKAVQIAPVYYEEQMMSDHTALANKCPVILLQKPLPHFSIFSDMVFCCIRTFEVGNLLSVNGKSPEKTRRIRTASSPHRSCSTAP